MRLSESGHRPRSDTVNAEMRLLAYAAHNLLHYAGHAKDLLDGLLIRSSSGMSYQRMTVPHWNEARAAQLRSGTSALSRLLATNQTAVHDADEVMAGSIRLFSTVVHAAGGLPDWHRDHLSNTAFRVKPYPLYRIHEDAGSDIIAVWELSRLQFVATLVQAYRASGDRKYADHFYAVVEHWHRSNPYLMGANWMCGLDVAIRAYNIAVGLVYLDAPSPERKSACLRLLWAHVDYLQHHDLYRQKRTINNHQLIAAILHLAILGLFDDVSVDAWRSQARDIVSIEAGRQFHPDGGNFESALLYHQFVLEAMYAGLGLMTDSTLELDSDENDLLPPTFIATLVSATQFVADYVRVWQGVPQVGDSSDGRVLMHRDYFAWQPNDASYLADWSALMLTSADPFQARPGTKVPQIYRDSGLGLYSGGAYSAIFCATPVTKAAGGHNHLDKASILLRTERGPVLVDSGTYCYTHDLSARSRFRRGRAHNVLLVAGRDQAGLPGHGAFEVPSYQQVGIDLSRKAVQTRGVSHVA